MQLSEETQLLLENNNSPYSLTSSKSWATRLQSPFETLKREELANASKLLGFTYLQEFLGSIDELSSFTNKKTLRVYLQQALKHGYFWVSSPIDGRYKKSGGSIILPNKTCFVCVPEIPGVLLGVGNLGLGYPIFATFFVSHQTVIMLETDLWSFQLVNLNLLASIIENKNWLPDYANPKKILVTGDGNYAHNAWNELGTFEEIAAIGSVDSNVSVISTHETIGPFKSLFPEFSHLSTSVLAEYLLPDLNNSGQLILPVGSSLISKLLVDRIIKYSLEQPIGKQFLIAKHTRDSGNPVLWLSLRARDRIALNLTTLLVDISARFLSQYPQGKVILDGYSVPYDIESNPCVDLRIKEFIEVELEQALEIQGGLTKLGIDSNKILIAIGCPISESLLLAQYASFYFCHHGSVQHKIGWFSQIYGIVHSNSVVLAGMPKVWFADQSEIALPATYVDPILIDDMPLEIDEERLEHRENLQIHNYIFNDVTAIADFVLKEFEKTVMIKNRNPKQWAKSSNPVATM